MSEDIYHNYIIILRSLHFKCHRSFLLILTFLFILKDVAKFINQLKRDDENLRSVQDVQER